MTETKPKKKGVQPKKHAPKDKMSVAMRRKKLIQAKIEGKNLEEVAISTGLSPKTAEHQAQMILREPAVKEDFKTLLDKICPDDRLTKKYGVLLESTKVISAMVIASDGEGMKDANSMTRDFVEVPDYPTQLKTADSISKLKGHIIDKLGVGGLGPDGEITAINIHLITPGGNREASLERE